MINSNKQIKTLYNIFEDNNFNSHLFMNKTGFYKVCFTDTKVTIICSFI